MTTRQRPLSPHLQVYRPQLTSIMSIAHRASGIANSAGSLLLVYWLAALAAGPDSFASASSLLGSLLGQLILFGFSVSLFYHLSNGIRHLMWDTGHGFDLPSVYRTGRMVMVSTAVLTVVAWGFGLAMR
jgi:succinate dehydrogenase / fumarate reductase, cytochrome b subunit